MKWLTYEASPLASGTVLYEQETRTKTRSGPVYSIVHSADDPMELGADSSTLMAKHVDRLNVRTAVSRTGPNDCAANTIPLSHITFRNLADVASQSQNRTDSH